MDGCIIDPGKGAGYAVGRNRMQFVCMHATAGGNDPGYTSYARVKNGVPDAPSTLAQWLVPYDGAPWQFTEADALCYDSPPNDDGPGIEIERGLTGGIVRPGLSNFPPDERQPSRVDRQDHPLASRRVGRATRPLRRPPGCRARRQGSTGSVTTVTSTHNAPMV